jgi:hypothetical protein
MLVFELLNLLAFSLFIFGIVLAVLPEEFIKYAPDPQKRRKLLKIIAVVLLISSVLFARLLWASRRCF